MTMTQGCHAYHRGIDLKDATLMLLAEAGGHPSVASLAKSAYDKVASGEDVDYRLLDDLISEASGKGVLRVPHARHSPVAYEAIIMPILSEIGRKKPVPQRRRPADDTESDPLRASAWPSR
jgi:hypothetical protein